MADDDATGLNLLTIYDHPPEHPGHFVLTSWWAGVDGVRLLGWALCDTLEQARAVPIARGMACFMRSDEDPAHVVETWL